MSVNSISTLLPADQFDGAQTHPPIINVSVKNGKTPSPKQFLEPISLAPPAKQLPHGYKSQLTAETIAQTQTQNRRSNA